MKKKIISYVVSMALILGVFLGVASQNGSKKVLADDGIDLFDQARLEQEVEHEIESLKEGEYVEGEAIVALSIPAKSKFARKGVAKFDQKIQIENALNFGEASDLIEDLSKKTRLTDDNIYIFTVSSKTYSTAELMRSLAKQDYVISVFPNRILQPESLSNDSYAGYQWYTGPEAMIRPDTSTGAIPSGSSATGAALTSRAYFHGSGSGANHAASSLASNPPVVAVLDSGINYTHEDLAENMWTNPYGANVLKGTNGYDTGDNDSDPMDIAGHGTHCAGIIGALANNNKGIAGLSSNVKIMAVKIGKISEKGDLVLTDDSILAGLDYVYQAQNAGVNVVALNCSFGTGHYILDTLFTTDSRKNLVKSIFDKIGQKGALLVFAAGNDGIDMTLFASAYSFTYGSPYVVSVGSTGLSDQKSTFSNFSSQYIDIMAPGEQILSTYYQPVFLPDIYSADARNRFCAFYNDVSNEDHPLIGGQELGLSGQVEITKDYTHDFAGDTRGACYHVNVSRDASENGEIYIDITDLDMNFNRYKYYFSVEAGTLEQGQILWDHVNHPGDNDRVKTIGQKKYFRLASLTPGIELYLDNISISKQIVNEADLGYYEFMNGTSMAAPVVTAAVARLYALYPNDNAVTRRAKLMASVRQIDSLKNFCVSGGIIDYSKMTDPAVSAIQVEDTMLASPSPSPKATTKPEKKIKKPERTYLRSIRSPKKKTVKIRWYQTSRAKKYEVQISQKKNFSRKKIRRTSSKKITVKGLKRKKKYFVRVRGYNSSGKGRWSRTWKVRVK